MEGQKKKEIKMATTTTLGYNLLLLPNRDSSSPSPTLSQRRRSTNDQPQPQPQGHTLVFNDQIQTQSSINNNNNQHVYGNPLAPVPQQQQQQQQQSERISTDLDLISGGEERRRSSKILYRECLRNHAASLGSHVVDGCGEFMPSGEDGTPESLKCAACDCHRNFHRKELQLQGQQSQQKHVFNPTYHSYYTNKHNNNGHLHFSTPTPPISLSHQQHHRFSHVLPTSTAGGGGAPAPPLMMAFGGGPAAESSISEDLNMFQCNQVQPVSKKRFRTKFSQEQKDRMMEFAEKIGWKIQKHDEEEVQQFCCEMGIKRQVFKVWMHNNKQAMKKTTNVSS